MRLDLHPANQASFGGYVFILVGWDDTELPFDGTRRSDLAANIGGPFDKIEDNPLRNLLLSGASVIRPGSTHPTPPV